MTKRDDDIVGKWLLKLPEKYRIIPVLFGAVLIQLSLGTYHTFGNMVPYMASYMRNRTNPTIDIDHLMWIPTFQGCFPFAMIIGGFLSSKLGPRIGAFIGCVFMSSGVLLSAFTIQKSLLLFMFTYGVMFGLGQGVTYVIVVSSVINWAPGQIGMFSGLIAGAFGISAAIFTPLQTTLINPENYPANLEGYYTHPTLLDRVPGIFLFSAGTYVCMQIIGLIFLCDPPKNQPIRIGSTLNIRKWVSDPFLVKHSIIMDGKESKKSLNGIAPMVRSSRRRTQNPRKPTNSTLESCTETDVEYSTDSSEDDSPEYLLLDAIENADCETKIVLQSWTFYVLFLTLFCCSFYGNLYYNLYKTFSNQFIDDDLFMAGAFSLGTLSNAVARILWGIIADKYSFQFALTLATSAAAFLLFTMPLTPLGGKPMYLIWLISMFTCIAANQTLFITAAVKCFGSKHKSINYGCLIFSTTISGILLSAICQTLLSYIGYTWMFIIAGSFAVLALISCSITRFTPHGHSISIRKRSVKQKFQFFAQNLELIQKKGQNIERVV